MKWDPQRKIDKTRRSVQRKVWVLHFLVCSPVGCALNFLSWRVSWRISSFCHYVLHLCVIMHMSRYIQSLVSKEVWLVLCLYERELSLLLHTCLMIITSCLSYRRQIKIERVGVTLAGLSSLSHYNFSNDFYECTMIRCLLLYWGTYCVVWYQDSLPVILSQQWCLSCKYSCTRLLLLIDQVARGEHLFIAHFPDTSTFVNFLPVFLLAVNITVANNMTRWAWFGRSFRVTGLAFIVCFQRGIFGSERRQMSTCSKPIFNCLL